MLIISAEACQLDRNHQPSSQGDPQPCWKILVPGASSQLQPGRRDGKAPTRRVRRAPCRGQTGWLRFRQREETPEPALAGGTGTWGQETLQPCSTCRELCALFVSPPQLQAQIHS